MLLALIGRRWSSVCDRSGARRLDSPDDFVRIEIEIALEQNVQVLPVLVDGARLPSAAELPPTLAGLSDRPCLELSPSRFGSNVDELVRLLERTRSAAPARQAVPSLPLTPDERSAWLVANGYGTPVIRLEAGDPGG